MEEWLKNFIKKYEGFIEVAKILPNEKYPTIGHGIYQYYSDGTPIKVGDVITKEKAEQEMLAYIQKVMPEIYKYFPKFDLFPELTKGAIIDTVYRGGGPALSKSPKFVNALNKGFEDGEFTPDELSAITKEMGLKSAHTGNLDDRKLRRAAMFYGIYNSDHANTINTVDGNEGGNKLTPYSNFHNLVNTPGTMWNTVYRSTKSPANFVLRLWDPKKEYIKDWEKEGHTATHKLAYVGEDDYEVVYPEVQYTDYPWYRVDKPNDGLHDFSDPKYEMDWKDIYQQAVENGDTLHVPKGTGELFTTLYKNYYPGFKKVGGTINYLNLFK